MDRLTDLQSRVLRILADIDPAFTLTGGAALVGFHLGHRTTRDLDLFWHGRSSIADVRREVLARLRTAGLSTHELFIRFDRVLLVDEGAGQRDANRRRSAWSPRPRDEGLRLRSRRESLGQHLVN